MSGGEAKPHYIPEWLATCLAPDGKVAAQEQVAKAGGMTPSTLSGIKKGVGRKTVKLGDLAKIAKGVNAFRKEGEFRVGPIDLLLHPDDAAALHPFLANIGVLTMLTPAEREELIDQATFKASRKAKAS